MKQNSFFCAYPVTRPPSWSGVCLQILRFPHSLITQIQIYTHFTSVLVYNLNWLDFASLNSLLSIVCFKNLIHFLNLQQAQRTSELLQTSPSCPALCAKVCEPDCPVRCCNAPPPSFYVPSPPLAPTYCPQICYSMCVSSCPADCCASTQRGVNRDTLLYSVSLPCPTNCYHSCSVNCPLQCCNAAIKRYRPMAQPAMESLIAGNYLRSPRERTVPFMDLHPPSLSNIMIRSKLPCPDVCNKVCSLRCSKECCRRQSRKGRIKQPIQNISQQGSEHLKFEYNTLRNSHISSKLSMCGIQIHTGT